MKSIWFLGLDVGRKDTAQTINLYPEKEGYVQKIRLINQNGDFHFCSLGKILRSR